MDENDLDKMIEASIGGRDGFRFALIATEVSGHWVDRHIRDMQSMVNDVLPGRLDGSNPRMKARIRSEIQSYSWAIDRAKSSLMKYVSLFDLHGCEPNVIGLFETFDDAERQRVREMKKGRMAHIRSLGDSVRPRSGSTSLEFDSESLLSGSD